MLIAFPMHERTSIVQAGAWADPHTWLTLDMLGRSKPLRAASAADVRIWNTRTGRSSARNSTRRAALGRCA